LNHGDWIGAGFMHEGNVFLVRAMLPPMSRSQQLTLQPTSILVRVMAARMITTIKTTVA